MAEYFMMFCPVLLGPSQSSLRRPWGKKLILMAVAIINIGADYLIHLALLFAKLTKCSQFSHLNMNFKPQVIH